MVNIAEGEKISCRFVGAHLDFVRCLQQGWSPEQHRRRAHMGGQGSEKHRVIEESLV